MVPKSRKFQNWPGDLGDDFGDLAFLKLFEEKSDFWRPAERPKKSGSARKWAKKFNAATFGSPGASPERPKGPCGPHGKRSLKKFDFQRNLNQK